MSATIVHQEKGKSPWLAGYFDSRFGVDHFIHKFQFTLCNLNYFFKQTGADLSFNIENPEN